MPNQIDLQFDGRLTDVSVKYSNPTLIADLVLPPVTVPQIKGTYKKYSKDERFTVPHTYVGAKSVPNEVEWNAEEDTFLCKDYGLQEFISQQEVDNSEAPFSLQSDTVDFLTELILLDKEIQLRDLIFDSTSYPSTHRIDGAAGWGSASATAVVSQMQEAIDACFMPPNVAVVDKATWRWIARNTELLSAVAGTNLPSQIRTVPGGTGAGDPGRAGQGMGGLVGITAPQLAAYLGLDAVYIGTAKYNTANPGATAVYDDVWKGDTQGGTGAMAFLRVGNPNFGLRDAVFASQFMWKTREVLTTPTDRGARGGQNIRVVESRVFKTVATDVGAIVYDTLVA